MNTQTTQIRKQLISRKETQFVINSPLGSTIKFRRKQLNMTLEETAEDLSSVSYLSKLENNLIKPNQKYVKLLEKRLNTTFEKIEVDREYQSKIKDSLQALLMDYKINEDIYHLYSEKKDHQAYLFMLGYFTSRNKLHEIKYFYEDLVSYIPNFSDDELFLFLTCVAKINMYKERYLEAYDIIQMFPKRTKEDVLIDTIQAKLLLICSFQMKKTSQIENLFRKYMKNLHWMHAFDLIYQMHVEYLIYQASHQSLEFIEHALAKIPTMNQFDKTYILALSYYHHQDFNKARQLSEPHNQLGENWLLIYLLSLDHLNESLLIKKIVETKISNKFDCHSTELIVRHLYFKHAKNETELLSYLRELSLNRYQLTDNFEMLGYIYKDASKLFSQYFFYKEAHQILSYWTMEQSILTKSHQYLHLRA